MLLTLIENKRSELLEVVKKKGMSSSTTLKISQELDSLLNQYNQFVITK
ncbi:sporulation protein Spo0E [Sutcliffiella cohnii]|uniref:Sporulation protein Spo0E n=2 Tax=Bacillaceae TaxID=186817 RepID=A0A223KY79_9BACI|nr:sporulation protein Spo0E [Sutcliffiella cohnii]